MQLRLFSLFLLSGLSLSGCQKDPGIGGFARVSGVIWVEDWNAGFTAIQSTYAAMDEDVYLVFGEDITYGADEKTSYNGAYTFKYLYPGKYKVYAYSDRLETAGNTSKTEPILLEFEIKEKRQEVTLDTIVIKK